MWYVTLASPLTELSAPCSRLVYFGSTIISKPTLNYYALCGWNTVQYSLLIVTITVLKLIHQQVVNFPEFSHPRCVCYWTISIAFCRVTSTSPINLSVRTKRVCRSDKFAKWRNKNHLANDNTRYREPYESRRNIIFKQWRVCVFMEWLNVGWAMLDNTNLLLCKHGAMAEVGGAAVRWWRWDEAVFRMRGARLVTGMCARGALRRLNYL